MKQERKFFVFGDGKITYFKELEKKGEIQLTKNSTVRKINRYEVELTTPETQRVYTLLQCDLTKVPQKKEGFSCMLDDWVEAINQVVEYIKANK